MTNQPDSLRPELRPILGNVLSRVIEPDPSLTYDLNLFRNDLPPGLTFSRASAATDVINGALTSFASGAPRISVANGYLPENQATNGIVNSMMVGASAGNLPTGWNFVGSQSGITRTIVGTGTENGFTYIDLRFSGTATSTSTIAMYYNPNSTQAASLSQTFTHSVYAKIIDGSTTNLTNLSVRMDEQSSSNTYLSGSIATDILSGITSDFKRFSNTHTTANASVAYIQGVFRIAATNGTAIDVTIRLAAPQLEAGPKATSYIPTTTAAATRAADKLTVTSLTGLTGNIGTVFAEVLPFDAGTSTLDEFIFQIGTSGWDPANYIALYRSTAAAGDPIKGRIRHGYGIHADMDAGAITAGAVSRVAMAYSLDNSATASLGRSAISDTSCTVDLAAATQILIGRSANDSSVLAFSGYVRAVKLYNVRKTNAELQAMTA